MTAYYTNNTVTQPYTLQDFAHTNLENTNRSQSRLPSLSLSMKAQTGTRCETHRTKTSLVAQKPEIYHRLKFIKKKLAIPCNVCIGIYTTCTCTIHIDITVFAFHESVKRDSHLAEYVEL